MTDRSAAAESQQAQDLPDWRVLGAGAEAWFEASSLSACAVLLGRIAESAGNDGLPDVDLRPSGLRVRIGSGSADLAQAISANARDLGLSASPGRLQTVRVGIDAADPASVASFWQPVLGYRPIGADLIDPWRRDPALSVRPLDEPRLLRNRIHLDVVRVPEAVSSIRAAVGQEPYGVYGLTLADAEGNEVDLVPGDALSADPATSDWRVVFSAMTFYPTSSATRTGRLVAAVAGLADDAGVPLLIDARRDGVVIDSGKDQWEDDGHGSAARFAELAGRVQAAARELGLVADPAGLRFVQFGIDAVDIPAAQAFWIAALGYQHDPRQHVTDIYDPDRLDPVIFFQNLESAEQDRRRQPNRIRLELCVPDDRAQPRIDAAVAAGGQLLDRTPGRIRLADPEGNELDIVTQ
ncbi:VOC family protein [Nakamurella lactea]|uniref:VOC family protein n=1 Tax=Nakamurella lactea TaxID=459515 RepID=UPI000423B403|nr:VOC family protein [Nakamurella lactea]